LAYLGAKAFAMEGQSPAKCPHIFLICLVPIWNTAKDTPVKLDLQLITHCMRIIAFGVYNRDHWRTFRTIMSEGFVKQSPTITSTIVEVRAFSNPYLVVSISKAITTLVATYSSFMLAASKAKLIGAKLNNGNLHFYKSVATFQFGSELLKLLQNTGPNPGHHFLIPWSPSIFLDHQPTDHIFS
jgi:hypothetical protein